jgi:hypothetical protein
MTTAALFALALLLSQAVSRPSHVCTCACCESCLYPAQDVGSFGVSDCGTCSAERCRAALAMPVGGCPASGGSVEAVCTAANETPTVSVTQYMDGTCDTVVEPEATYIVGKCYTRVDIGLSVRAQCNGTEASRTSWTGIPGGLGPFCPDNMGTGPLRLGAPSGGCVEGTPGAGNFKVEYSAGAICPGPPPPPCSFHASPSHPGQGTCDPTCPEITDCGCGLLEGYCTGNLDANCQIPQCCKCCSWPCSLQPDPAACCDDHPACCLGAGNTTTLQRW